MRWNVSSLNQAWVQGGWLTACFVAAIALILLRNTLPEWLQTPSDSWTQNLPLPYLNFGGDAIISLSWPGTNIADWFNAIIEFLRNNKIFGLVTFKEVTREVAQWIVWPLDKTERILVLGFRDLSIPGIPWIISVALAAILGWHLKGWPLALLSGSCIAYFSVFGLWKLAMTTLSLVLVTAPIAVTIGLFLGILAMKSRSFEKALWPLLNLMQSLPHFGYLIPIVVFVGLGHKAGAIATILFAIPPMAKLTLVGLQGVSKEVLDAGVMAGCTPVQMLWRVRIPAAQKTLMVGVNQVIMQCLAMVVIASFVGARGLGIDLLFRLQTLQLGRALESGIAIVLMAITLDRLSQALAEREPEHKPEGNFWVRHPYIVIAIAAILLGALIAHFIPQAVVLPRGSTVTFAPYWDFVIKNIVFGLYEPLSLIRDYAPPYFLMPIRDFFKELPWPVFVGVLMFLGWRLGGWRMAIPIGLLLGFIVISSWWTEFMITTYLVFVAVIVCVIWGFPVGVWASKRGSRTRVVAFLCDTFQTFPSFIYLIPVVMLFQVGTISQIMAIVIYAGIPMVRYTYLGLRNVPHEIVEAAITSGCTPRQILWKVRMPLALPEITLGLNQTIMFSLFMVMIAGFIGGNYDLAREIFKAKANNDAGLGILLALCVAFLGLTMDRLLQEWVKRRKEKLGLAIQ